MPNAALPCLDAARAAATVYVRASVRARDHQYQFLARAYLAYQEGQRRRSSYAKHLQAILKRSPTGPEQKRPLLHLLHALLGNEDDIPRNALPQLSKLTSALEELDKAFSDLKPTTDEIIAYIRDAGGVGGLYDLSRFGGLDGTDDAKLSQSEKPFDSILPFSPTGIPLPAIGANVMKVGRGYRLRLQAWEPGEYVVRIRVGPGGFLQALHDIDDADEEVA